MIDAQISILRIFSIARNFTINTFFFNKNIFADNYEIKYTVFFLIVTIITQKKIAVHRLHAAKLFYVCLVNY